MPIRCIRNFHYLFGYFKVAGLVICLCIVVIPAALAFVDNNERIIPSQSYQQKNLEAINTPGPLEIADPGHSTSFYARYKYLLWGGTVLTALILFIIMLRLNILRLKKANSALFENQKKLRRIFETMQDGYLIADMDGRILMANPAAARLLKYELDDLLTKNMVRDIYINPEDRALLKERLAKHKSLEGHESLFKKKSGEMLVADFNLNFVYNDQNEPVAIEGIFRDKTKRKQIENALRESEARFRTLVENAPEAIVVCDFDSFRFIDANKNAESLFGMKRKELLKVSPVDLSPSHQPDGNPSSDKTWKYISNIADQQASNIFEWMFYNKSGKEFLCEVRLARLPGTGRNHFRASLIDITERKKAEIALRRERNFSMSVIQRSPTFFLAITSDGKVKMVNQAMLDALNYEMEEMVGKDYLSTFVPPREHEALSSIFDDIIHGRYSKSENHVLTRDGRELMVEWHGAPVFNENRQFDYFFGFGIDITRRKQRERALRFTRFSVDYAMDAIFLGNSNGNLIDVNRAACRSLGYSREELLKLCAYDIDTSVTVENWKDFWTEARTRKAFTWDTNHVRKDGSEFPVEITVNHMEYEGEGYICAFSRDITKRKHAEQALIESEERNRILVQNAPEAILVIDVEAERFIDCNENAMKLLGYSRDEICSLGPCDIVYLPDTNEPAIKEAIKAVHINALPKEQFSAEVLIQTSADNTINGEMRLVHLPSKERHLARVSLIDITERKRAEKELATYRDHLEDLVDERTAKVKKEIAERHKAEAKLQKAKEAAEAANLAKSLFLANMSHELRTPLNAILGFPRLMEKDENVTKTQREYLDIINRNGEHLLNLINDILDMSKIEAGYARLNAKTFNLQRLVMSIEDIMGVRAREKGLQFDVHLDTNIPKYIKSDAHKLRQVLINLLGNAVKFTSSGAVHLRVSGSKSDVTDNGHMIHFEIEDTGPGISQDEMGILFEMFSQTKSGRKSKEGTGLGLAISRKFVRMMGGDITVESTMGKGSVFKFNINIQKPDMAEVDSLKSMRRVICLLPGQPTYRILIVEDRKESRELLRIMLEGVGFNVKEAVNGEQAVKKYISWKPHLIWMDMRMPVMDGYDAARTIKSTKDGKRTFIIALTAGVFEEERAKVLAAGCDDFIRKPFEENELFDTMGRYLGIKYRYEKKEHEIPDLNQVNEFAPEDLTDVPKALLKALKEAADDLDTGLVRDIIEKISKRNISAGIALDGYAKQFQFEYISELLSEVQ